MTIEELYKRSDICVQTRNLCINEQIKTFKDIVLHFHKSGSFRNLRYCGERSNDELIAVYNKYKDIYAEDEISEPVAIYKGEPKLEDVVTDLSDVIKTTLSANVYLERLEYKLHEYWRTQDSEEATESDVAESCVDATLETTYTADLENIEDKLQDYWREKKVPLSDEPEYSEKAIAGVTDIVDLGGVEKTIKDYLRRLATAELRSSKYTKNTKKPEQSQQKHWEKEVNKVDKGNDIKGKSTFGMHPSKQLNDLYKIKSHQGANPIDAKVIFVSRNSNWAADIEEKEMFGYVVDYLTDGVAFWETHDIHHPFLLMDYKGDGRKYHRAFMRLNLDSSVASEVSFVELIRFPTIGMAGLGNALFKEYLYSEENSEHLIELDKILSNNEKMIFIAWGLIDDFKQIYERTGLFEQLAKLDKSKMDINDLNEYENIFIHRHFSVGISLNTLAKMEERLRKIL